MHDLAFAAMAERLRAAAPHLTLRVIETDHRVVWDQIGSGFADLSVTVASPPPKGLGTTVLGEQRFVLLHRAGQAPPATLDADLQAPHVAVGFADRSRGYTDERLAAMGRTRRIVAVTPRFAAIPDLVRVTGALATMLAPIARHQADDGSGLSTAALPFDLRPVPVRMGWHQRRRTDPLNEWARRLVGTVVQAEMFA
ncbi:MAG: LysR substrate-binding domain-containing protein [Pseudomonadota bacterium]